MLDGRYGCAVMACTGSLLRLLTVLLVLYRRSLIALYRFLTAPHSYLHFLCRIDDDTDGNATRSLDVS